MKNLKLPRTVMIASDTFKMKYNKKGYGASFDFVTGVIEIGTARLEFSPSSVFASIMHEVSEIAHCICNTRYEDHGTLSDFKFFMTHKEFQTHTEMVAQAMLQFIK